MRTSKQIGNLIRAYANDEEGSRFTKYQINALVNNSGLAAIKNASKEFIKNKAFILSAFYPLANYKATCPPKE